MSTLRSYTRANTPTPLFDCIVVQVFPFATRPYFRFSGSTLLLKNTPYIVINRVEVWMEPGGHSDGKMKSGVGA